MRHRVGETLDPSDIRRLARDGMTMNRAAQFLGVNWSTLYRVAGRHGIVFARHTRGYGWHGVDRG